MHLTRFLRFVVVLYCYKTDTVVIIFVIYIMLVFTSIVLWDKDEVIRFRGEKVKSEGRVRQNQLELDIEFQPSG